MRSDMYKVIVERPRKGKSADAQANRFRKDFDGPSHLGMRAGLGYRELNENLNPLKRFLKAQVGRPWNKVYSEISAGIDRRNTVQLHIFAHLDQMIAVKVEWDHGQLIDLKDRYYWHDRRTTLRQPLYVDPRTGLIRVNKAYRSRTSERAASRKLEEEQLARRFRRIDADNRLMLLEGQWYEVRLADVPPAIEIEVVRDGKAHRRYRVTWVYDVVLGKKVCARIDDGTSSQRRELYGESWRRDRYAISKRQLSRREIAKFKLPREEIAE